MKQTLIVSLGAILCAVLLFSCQKDEQIYSCDPDVNALITENPEQFKGMGVEKLSTYSREVQKAAFNMTDDEGRYNLWKEKFEILLTQKDKFNKAELLHIKKLADFIKEDFFDTDKSDSTEIKAFASKWGNFAINNLHWTKERARYIAQSFDTNENKYKESISSVETSAADCNCHVQNDGWWWDDCGYPRNCQFHNDPYCDMDYLGCGFIWSDNCNAKCRY